MQLPDELTPTILDANPALLTHKRRRGCMFFFFHFNYREFVLTPSLSQAIHSFDGLAGAVPVIFCSCIHQGICITLYF